MLTRNAPYSLSMTLARLAIAALLLCTVACGSRTPTPAPVQKCTEVMALGTSC